MGFSVECIRNIQQLPDGYFCAFCRSLVYPDEAVQTQCGHLYCKPCLASVLHTTKSCPSDGYPVSEANSQPLRNSNNLLADSISQVIVRCLYFSGGCPWQGTLSEWIMHKTNCACGNYGVICTSCSTRMLHRQLEEHMQFCPAVSAEYDCQYQPPYCPGYNPYTQQWMYRQNPQYHCASQCTSDGVRYWSLPEFLACKPQVRKFWFSAGSLANKWITVLTPAGFSLRSCFKFVVDSNDACLSWGGQIAADDIIVSSDYKCFIRKRPTLESSIVNRLLDLSAVLDMWLPSLAIDGRMPAYFQDLITMIKHPPSYICWYSPERENFFKRIVAHPALTHPAIRILLYVMIFKFFRSATADERHGFNSAFHQYGQRPIPSILQDFVRIVNSDILLRRVYADGYKGNNPGSHMRATCSEFVEFIRHFETHAIEKKIFGLQISEYAEIDYMISTYFEECLPYLLEILVDHLWLHQLLLDAWIIYSTLG